MTHVRGLWVTAERRPLIDVVYPAATFEPDIEVPPRVRQDLVSPEVTSRARARASRRSRPRYGERAGRVAVTRPRPSGRPSRLDDSAACGVSTYVLRLHLSLMGYTAPPRPGLNCVPATGRRRWVSSVGLRDSGRLVIARSRSSEPGLLHTPGGSDLGRRARDRGQPQTVRHAALARAAWVGSPRPPPTALGTNDGSASRRQHPPAGPRDVLRTSGPSILFRSAARAAGCHPIRPGPLSSRSARCLPAEVFLPRMRGRRRVRHTLAAGTPAQHAPAQALCQIQWACLPAGQLCLLCNTSSVFRLHLCWRAGCREHGAAGCQRRMVTASARVCVLLGRRADDGEQARRPGPVRRLRRAASYPPEHRLDVWQNGTTTRRHGQASPGQDATAGQPWSLSTQPCTFIAAGRQYRRAEELSCRRAARRLDLRRVRRPRRQHTVPSYNTRERSMGSQAADRPGLASRLLRRWADSIRAREESRHGVVARAPSRSRYARRR